MHPVRNRSSHVISVRRKQKISDAITQKARSVSRSVAQQTTKQPLKRP